LPLQTKPHALLTHTAVAWATDVAHASPHVLQFCGLVVVSTQLVPHIVGDDGGQLEVHA
jgi:hypothetical protein